MRFARLFWILVFLVPLGALADRLCYVDLADPTYHTLMWMHERLPLIFIALAALSAFAALLRFMRIQGQLRALEALRSRTPDPVLRAFERAAARTSNAPLDVVYIDIAAMFCFAVVSGRIVLSRGFVELLNDDELRLVAAHEVLHIRAADPIKAILWHLFFAALILPGFDRVEELLYAQRERAVDHVARKISPVAYDALLKRFDTQLCAATPSAAFRALDAPKKRMFAARALAPAIIPVTLLAVLAASHVFFVQNLPYLQSHHC